MVNLIVILLFPIFSLSLSFFSLPLSFPLSALFSPSPLSFRSPIPLLSIPLSLSLFPSPSHSLSPSSCPSFSLFSTFSPSPSLFSLLLSLFLFFFISLFPRPVLKPYFHLSLCQNQWMGNFNAPFPWQILVEMELLLQLQHLVPRVRSPLALFASRSPFKRNFHWIFLDFFFLLYPQGSQMWGFRRILWSLKGPKINSFENEDFFFDFLEKIPKNFPIWSR